VEAIPLDEGAEKPTVLPPHTAQGNDGAEDVPLEFDQDEGWRLPEGKDLRDLLSSTDES
jgi:hypothetical protein